MYYYKLYGVRVASDFELKQLVRLAEDEQILEPQITIMERSLAQVFDKQNPFYYKVDTQVSYVSNSFCYMLMEEGKNIFYEKKTGVTPQLLNAYILGWGIAILFYQRGQLALHGSCLREQKKALVISGNSGSGKSTVTEELLKRGFGFMADDMVVVQKSQANDMLATAAFPYQKLCRDVAEDSAVPKEEMIYIDEAKDKYLVPYQGDFDETSASINTMIILKVSDIEQVSVQELVGGDKFRASMDALFLQPLLGEQLYIPEQGRRILEFASKVQIYQIERPREKNSKDEIVDAILEIWQRS